MKKIVNLVLAIVLFGVFQLTVAAIDMDGSFSLNYMESYTSKSKKIVNEKLDVLLHDVSTPDDSEIAITLQRKKILTYENVTRNHYLRKEYIFDSHTISSRDTYRAVFVANSGRNAYEYAIYGYGEYL